MLYAAMTRRAAHQGRKKPPGRGFINDVKMIEDSINKLMDVSKDNIVISVKEGGG